MRQKKIRYRHLEPLPGLSAEQLAAQKRRSTSTIESSGIDQLQRHEHREVMWAANHLSDTAYLLQMGIRTFRDAEDFIANRKAANTNPGGQMAYNPLDDDAHPVVRGDLTRKSRTPRRPW